MPIIFQKYISRDDMRANPKAFYLFGDNERRAGFGGQAKEMRGEPNAIGIRTKVAPGVNETAYWNDDNLVFNIQQIKEDFIPVRRLLEQKTIVIIPLGGFGTGLAELAKRAPQTLKYIESIIVKLLTIYNTKDECA